MRCGRWQKDGLIDDPRSCRFDFKTIECKGGDSASCLTAAQAATAQTITNPLLHPKTSETIFPGLALGTELGWGLRIGGPEPQFFGPEYFKYVFYKDPNWDWRTFDLAAGVAIADRADYRMLNATDPDLKRFQQRGGKLLIHRVERCEFLRPIHNRLLREHACRGWLPTDRGVATAVSRAGDGTLRGWRKAECVRPDSCARTVGRTRPRSGNNQSLTLH
jgi:hypothetical protein